MKRNRDYKKPFKFFMEQEIYSEVAASNRVLNYFADKSPLVTRIAFGSCAKQDKPQPIWEAIVAE